MNQLAQMLALVADKFKDKTDKSGKPYMLHCIRVMMQMPQDNEKLMCIALGHDLLEDTDVTYQDLGQLFNFNICQDILYLTHAGTTYEDYIKLIAQRPSCVLVKLADLKDNSDITRLKGLTKKDFDRIEKYHKAYTYLSKL